MREELVIDKRRRSSSTGYSRPFDLGVSEKGLGADVTNFYSLLVLTYFDKEVELTIEVLNL